MKLLRYGEPGAEKPGILERKGLIRNLSGHVCDIAGETLCPIGLDALRAIDIASLPVVDGNPRIGPCVAGTGKFICIGLNYSDHAEETGATVPSEPINLHEGNFGDHRSIRPGRNPTRFRKDRLGGRTRRRYRQDREIRFGGRGDGHVAGYCVVNDLSERAFQAERQGQWTKGKSADTFGPLGPWLVTADEVSDPQAPKMHLEVNGKAFQNGSTATMVYGVRHLVSYLSQFMSLRPGDIISELRPASASVRSRISFSGLAMSLPWASRVLANSASDAFRRSERMLHDRRPDAFDVGGSD